MTTAALLAALVPATPVSTNTERLALAGFLAGGKTTGSEVALAGLVQSLRHPGGWESRTV
jgi:hypothetical protein